MSRAEGLDLNNEARKAALEPQAGVGLRACSEVTGLLLCPGQASGTLCSQQEGTG